MIHTPELRARANARTGIYSGFLRIWNGKHNRYCSGLLIRSSMDFGVPVQLRPVPPHSEVHMAKTNENGFLICPRCGKKTNTKVLPETELKNFPLYCNRCKEAIKIDHKRARA